MDFSLPADLQHFVQAQLSAGHYESLSELVVDSLRALQVQREQVEKFRREEIQPSLDRLDRGEGVIVPAAEIGPYLDGLLADVLAELDHGKKSV